MTAASLAEASTEKMQSLFTAELAQAELVGRLRTELEAAQDSIVAQRPQSPAVLESNLQAAAFASLTSQVHAGMYEVASHQAQQEVAHAELRGESAQAGRLQGEVERLRKLDASSA